MIGITDIHFAGKYAQWIQTIRADPANKQALHNLRTTFSALQQRVLISSETARTLLQQITVLEGNPSTPLQDFLSILEAHHLAPRNNEDPIRVASSLQQALVLRELIDAKEGKAFSSKDFFDWIEAIKHNLIHLDFPFHLIGIIEAEKFKYLTIAQQRPLTSDHVALFLHFLKAQTPPLAPISEQTSLLAFSQQLAYPEESTFYKGLYETIKKRLADIQGLWNGQKRSSIAVEKIRAKLLGAGEITEATNPLKNLVDAEGFLLHEVPSSHSHTRSIEATPYQILTVLGQGGMGIVYLGQEIKIDPETGRFKKDPESGEYEVARLVAIKTAPKNNDTQEFFAREYAFHSLGIEGVLPVYQQGRNKRGLYIVMRLESGGTLAEERARLNKPYTEIPTKDLSYIKAVANIHERGKIHRDLKPENIFVMLNGECCIADGALAIDTHSRNREATGTIEFMPPEILISLLPSDHPLQSNFTHGIWTPSGDVFALGNILYERVTGHKAADLSGAISDATNVEKATLVLGQIHQNRIPSPSTLNPSISPELERIILKAMSRQAKDRYSSAKELFYDLITIEARALEEEGKVEDIKLRIEFLRRALQNYISLLSQWSVPQLKHEIIRVALDLWDIADDIGDESLLHEMKEVIGKHQSSESTVRHFPNIHKIDNTVKVNLKIPPLPAGVRAIAVHHQFSGNQTIAKKSTRLEGNHFDFERGPSAMTVFFEREENGSVIEAGHSVTFPLPPRPKEELFGDPRFTPYVGEDPDTWEFHIPYIQTTHISTVFTIFPAGIYSVRNENRPISYAGRLRKEDLRILPKPFAASFKIPQLTYWKWLNSIYEKTGINAALERAPLNWHPEVLEEFRKNPTKIPQSLKTKKGTYLSNKSPVTPPKFKYAQEFAQDFGGHVMTANQYFYACRGALNARAFPWGDKKNPWDATPPQGTCGSQYLGIAIDDIPLPIDARNIFDFSPFSKRTANGNLSRHPLNWMSTNVRTFLENDDPQRYLKFHPSTRDTIDFTDPDSIASVVLVGGTGIREITPDSLEYLKVYGRDEDPEAGFHVVIDL